MDKIHLPLFRKQAIDARRPQVYGRIVLLRPISFAIMTTVAVVIGSAIVAFLVLGSYTQHSTLTGHLVPSHGVIKVHAAQFGTIVEKRVREGDAVAIDDVLFVVSSERFTTTRGAAQSSMARELELQEKSLAEQIEHTQRLKTTDQESFERMVVALAVEETRLLSMIESQRERVLLASENAARYAKMRAEGFVPDQEFAAQRDHYLDQQARLHGLERDQATVRRQLTDLRNQSLSLPLKYENQLAELDRGVAAVRRELAENESRRLILVRAPQAGIAAAVIGEVGQVVDSTRPLLSIVPSDSLLEAHLYAPSRAVGFVEIGDRVLVRYDSYPYQKFGHHEGRVVAVFRSAVSAAELSTYRTQDQTAEPLYRVTVSLSSQSATAHGIEHPLQAGMMVQADVLLDTRRLYEWVLEPLYSVTGKLH